MNFICDMFSSVPGWIHLTSYAGGYPFIGNIIHVSTQVSIMFGLVFLVYSPEIFGNIFFFMIHSEPYSNEVVDVKTFIRLSLKYFSKTFAMMNSGKVII